MLMSGKRLLFVSGSDYGEDMQPLIFTRDDTVCGWNEPPLGSVDGVPSCQVNGGVIQVRAVVPIWSLPSVESLARPAVRVTCPPLMKCAVVKPRSPLPHPALHYSKHACGADLPALLQPRPLFDGLLTRVISCELQYGPLNCEFVWRGTNDPVFDELTLPPVRQLQAPLPHATPYLQPCVAHGITCVLLVGNAMMV